jgi:DMATS type aromatic prenyltransferase
MATASPVLHPTQHAVSVAPTLTAQQFWTKWLSDILGPLMAHSGSYTPEEMAVHLKFLEDHVAPTLGPLPSEPRNTYTQTYVDSPFEPSLNLTSSGKVKVRYGIEVVKPYGCEKTDDPFGEKRAREVLPALARACGADLQWINTAMDAFFLTKEETEAMRGKLPTFMPSALLAFDLDGDKTMMKIYIIGMRKAIASGLPSTNDFILRALRKLQPLGEQLAPGLDTVAEYVPFPSCISCTRTSKRLTQLPKVPRHHQAPRHAHLRGHRLCRPDRSQERARQGLPAH